MRPATLVPVLLIGFVLLAAAGGALLLRGAGSADLLGALPADASIVVHARNLPRLVEALGRSRLAENPADDDSRWEQVAEILQPLLGLEGVSAALAPESMARLLAGEVVFAQMPGRSGESPAFVLAATGPAGGERAAEKASRLLGSADGEPTGWIPRTHRGRPYSLLRVREGAGTVCVSGARGMVLIATSARTMRRVLDTLEGRGRSVARDQDWLVARDHLPRRADLYVHVSGSALRAWIEARADGSAFSRAAALAGAGAARHAALSVRIREGLFHESLFVVLSPEGRGLPGALFDGPPRAEAGAVPRDPRFAVNASIAWEDPGEAWGDLPGAVSAKDERLFTDLQARLEGLEEFLGLELQRDLLRSLGREMRISLETASPFPRGAAPHALRNLRWRASVQLRRADPVRRVLRRVDGLARAFATREAHGRGEETVTWYRIPALAPMAPSYRLTRRTLHAASSPDLLGAPPARAPTSSQGMFKHLPERAHIFFQASAGRLAEMGIGEHGPAPRTWPASALLSLAQSEALPPTVGAGRMEASGFLLQWISPASAPAIAWGAWDGWKAPPEGPETPPAATVVEDPLY